MANMSCPPINPTRIRILNPNSNPNPLITGGSNPVIYWMFRDQRASDNHALLHALHLSSSTSSPLAVVFNLFHPRFLNAAPRHLLFMLRGLRKVHLKLRALNVPFFLFHGNAVETIPDFAVKCNARVIVTDFSPLREVRRWKEEMVRRVEGLGIEVHEVDAHNVVPVWVASGKLEYGARTIRGKIGKLLGEYLVEFGEVGRCRVDWVGEVPQVDWDGLIAQIVSEGNGEVPEIGWCEPGEDAAMDVLMGSKDGFLTKRLKSYHTDRNNPLKPKALSCLSPYLHFGQISAQRCALMAKAYRSSNPQAIDAFLEELIIRRELADNFCYYQPQYDSVQGAWEWARKTLMDHAADKREHIYSKEQLEKGKTADPLWNACHLEMVHHGKMHGFLRMYWAKKILEWTHSPEEALSIAIYLNDKYSIDGRDPNGYVGCMWAICGIHDQGWRERPIFGKIRYMNYAGCKRKFNVDGYIAYVNRLVAESRKRKLSSSTPSLIVKQPRLTSPEQSQTSGYCPSIL